MATAGSGNRKATRLPQSLMRTGDSYDVGDPALTTKERRDRNMETFLRANCLGQINRNTWLFLAEKFGRFLSWNELTCNNKGIFFPVVGKLRGRINQGKITKQYWFFEACAGSPNICAVQVYNAAGKKETTASDPNTKGGKMQVWSDSCGNVTNENLELFMSWENFTRMPPLPLRENEE